jgi:hypothetical protein
MPWLPIPPAVNVGALLTMALLEFAQEAGAGENKRTLPVVVAKAGRHTGGRP